MVWKPLGLTEGCKKQTSLLKSTHTDLLAPSSSTKALNWKLLMFWPPCQDHPACIPFHTGLLFQPFLLQHYSQLRWKPLLPMHRENENANLKTYMHLIVYRGIIYNCQDIKITCLHQQMNGWKRCGMYKYTIEYDKTIKDNEISPFLTWWKNLVCIMLSEISQTKTNTGMSSIIRGR